MLQPHERDTALIALGANLARADEALQTTILDSMNDIAKALGPITGKSRLFRTPSFPSGAGPDYVNAAVVVQTSLQPAEILHELHRVERKFGRERQQRWGSRTLDLDLIAVSDVVSPNAQTQTAWRNLDAAAQSRTAPDQLILPHPRLQDRAFVLVPLADIAPDWVHPLLGLSVTEMLTKLPAKDVAQVVALA
ncbi:2-amino-4-hydroxy-6-hydroxymethyldihydropteridine diphosphokinase [Octadecabacter sp. R77987]|uniref:2-amino-4-hydroxy-6- hydroxymethyldihydropteridine diphosphokinase n=1 Tax=Octadecabacter sp. R77987 TaxID=3093874 RepID=UPI003671125B